MTLEDLINQYRIMANDKVEPYFISDEELTLFLNEAEVEACLRGRLLLKDLANIDLESDTPVYALEENVLEIVSVSIQDDYSTRNLQVCSVEEMDKVQLPNWRDAKGAPRFAVFTDKWLRLAPMPQDDNAKLRITAYCLPAEPMDYAEKDTVEPEIHQPHHRFLVYWALFRAFSIPDAEFMDQQRADTALTMFTRHFGLPADKDLKRDTRDNTPHHVEAFFV